ncbi:hypothetical protein [Rhizobium sp. AN80A]|uniref:hypothetical protein n=1 Tax=Rhizobium sp. AN80A TaxID=3040673 RepID=UPI0024B393A6|nr:hypothetical protein [Rhizobium sp. AN80A]
MTIMKTVCQHCNRVTGVPAETIAAVAAMEPLQTATDGYRPVADYSKPASNYNPAEQVIGNYQAPAELSVGWRPINSAPVGEAVWIAHSAGLMEPAKAVRTTFVADGGEPVQPKKIKPSKAHPRHGCGPYRALVTSQLRVAA